MNLKTLNEKVKKKQSPDKKLLDFKKIFNMNLLENINLDFLLTHFAKILTLYCYVEKEDDFVLILKDYTEIVQSEEFS